MCGPQRLTWRRAGGAVRLNEQLSDTVVNWSGGLHHAKKVRHIAYAYVQCIAGDDPSPAGRRQRVLLRERLCAGHPGAAQGIVRVSSPLPRLSLPLPCPYQVHQRVLYIDIDIHHGDGVEEAFYCTDR